MVHEAGLCSVLHNLHEELDRAVAATYGWANDLGDEEILERVVALNAQRAAEERRGNTQWLRTEFQQGAVGGEEEDETEQGELEVAVTPVPAKDARKWPTTLAERAQAVRRAVALSPAPALPEELAKNWKRARVADVAELLDTLASLGQVRRLPGNRFAV